EQIALRSRSNEVVSDLNHARLQPVANDCPYLPPEPAFRVETIVRREPRLSGQQTLVPRKKHDHIGACGGVIKMQRLKDVVVWTVGHTECDTVAPGNRGHGR